jgi:hypothetical protein
MARPKVDDSDNRLSCEDRQSPKIGIVRKNDPPFGDRPPYDVHVGQTLQPPVSNAHDVQTMPTSQMR